MPLINFHCRAVYLYSTSRRHVRLYKVIRQQFMKIYILILIKKSVKQVQNMFRHISGRKISVDVG